MYHLFWNFLKVVWKLQNFFIKKLFIKNKKLSLKIQNYKLQKTKKNFGFLNGQGIARRNSECLLGRPFKYKWYFDGPKMRPPKLTVTQKNPRNNPFIFGPIQH